MGVVRFLAPDTDAYVASVQRHAREFESQSGHRLDIRILGSDEYFSNRIGSRLSGADAADVFMSGPVLLWEHVGAGLVEPLDEHLAEVAGEIDLADFLPRLLEVNRWTGRFGDPLGAGPLLELPVNCESYNLAYVPAVLERAGVEVPGTWEQYFAAARTVVERTGGAVRGFGQRGTGVWHTMYTGFATQLWSCGGSDFAGGRCTIAAPEAVRATEDFVAALHAAGPTGWPDQRWYELALDFARGRYGLMVDSDHYVAYFEEPATSSLVGEIAYALPPLGPTGVRRPNLWTWSVAMNTRARDREEAWRFVEWATGRDFLLRSAFEGNMNPTRASVWDDGRFRAHTARWGAFHDVARTLIERDASVLVTPAPNYLAVGSRWVEALLDVYRRHAGAAEALQIAAPEIDDLVTS